MAEVKFYLEKRRDKITGEVITKNVPIFLFYSFHGQRLQYYTNMRIDAQKWNEETMKVKKNYSEAGEYNRELTRLKAKVEELYDKAKVLNETPTLEYFRDNLNGRLLDLIDKKTIWEAYKDYLKSLAVSKTPKTVSNAKLNYKILEDFSKSRRYKLTFENINQRFYDEYLDYCFNEKKYFNNYVGTNLKRLKAFLNWAHKNGYHKTVEFKKEEFKNTWENTEIIYLYYDEVMTLLNLKLENKTLAEVRDLYCLGCFTGMRYSDIKGLKPENIQGDLIVNRTIKTKEPNIIPLNPHSKKIIKRHAKKHLPFCMPQYKGGDANQYLKKVMEKAKLTRSVQIIHFRGATRFEQTQPLWQCATFHTSKKSFVTNFLERGGSLTTAMAITGNRSYKSAQRYFKIADTLRAKEMAKVFGSVSAYKKSK
ncbi:MAG: site-specific integrase [Bacteroidetes bacterium]|nr:site-specific integrase [Bacteroidota bacterium]